MALQKMASMDRFKLRNLNPAQRILASAFLVGLGLAYAVALLFVFVKTDMKLSGIQTQFRGSSLDPAHEEEANLAQEEESDSDLPSWVSEWNNRSRDIAFPKSLKDMILTTHLHLLAISMILFLIGGIFSFSSFPEQGKGLVIGMGFLGLFGSYACMWALRYISGSFSIGVFAFGLMEAIAIAIQSLFSLKDLWFSRSLAGH